jgi:hypothetical protein
LIIGGLIGSGIFLTPLLTLYDYRVIISILENGLYYSNSGLNSNSKLSILISILNFIKIIWLNNLYIIAGTLTLIGIVFSIIETIKTKKIKTFNVFFILVLLLVIKSIYVSNNMFFHYTIFLWPIFFVFIGKFYYTIEKVKHNNALSLAFILCAFLIVSITTSFRKPYPFYTLLNEKEPIQLDKISKLIVENSTPNDKMIIWGWANKFYLTTKLQRGSGYLYPQFTTKNYPGSNNVIDMYYQDITRDKPRIILQLVCNECFYFKDTNKYAIDVISKKIYNYININYDLIASDNKFILYKKRESL